MWVAVGEGFALSGGGWCFLAPIGPGSMRSGALPCPPDFVKNLRRVWC